VDKYGTCTRHVPGKVVYKGADVLAEKLRHHTTYQPLRRFLFLDYHFSPWYLTIFSLLRSTYFSPPSFLAGGPILHRNTHTRHFGNMANARQTATEEKNSLEKGVVSDIGDMHTLHPELY
jgi:hypothetical protein